LFGKNPILSEDGRGRGGTPIPKPKYDDWPRENPWGEGIARNLMVVGKSKQPEPRSGEGSDIVWVAGGRNRVRRKKRGTVIKNESVHNFSGRGKKPAATTTVSNVHRKINAGTSVPFPHRLGRGCQKRKGNWEKKIYERGGVKVCYNSIVLNYPGYYR